MELKRFFNVAGELESRGDCSRAVFLCVPCAANHRYRPSAAEHAAFVAAADVLGTACGIARYLKLNRTRLRTGVPAWGVAYPHNKATFALFDGVNVWAQGSRGAVRLRREHLLFAWETECRQFSSL